MNWPVSLTITVTLSYLLGSVPFALLLGKVKGIDIRQAGSRNIGATTLTRLAGRPLATQLGYAELPTGA